MLKVAAIDDPQKNIIAPSVYIDSIEKEGNKYTVHYSLVDDVNNTLNPIQNSSWMSNQEVLNNLNVYISDGTTTEKRLLNTTLAANTIKNNKVKDYAILHNSSSSVTIQAWTGNSDLSGALTNERIISNGQIVKTEYNNTSYEYINKVKDFDILNFNIVLSSSLIGSNDIPLNTDLLVSYRPDKIASIGFVFNLEKYLLANSKTFNILKQNEGYKTTILGNSKIKKETSYFSKRNITKGEKDYTKIYNEIDVSLMNISGGLYYVGVVDDNNQKDNYSYYDVTVHLEIEDFSKNFVNDSLLKSLEEASTLLFDYKNLFISLMNDNTVEDVNNYIFENMYEQMIPNIKLFVDSISNISSLFSGIDSERFASLFVSLLHPLTTRVELLEKLNNYINKLENVISSINSVSTDAAGVNASIKNINYVFDKQFGNSGDNPYAADFNYDYDLNHGIEVLSADSLQLRLNETPTSLKEISTAELDSRKVLESRKYFNNPYARTGQEIRTFSISSIDFNSENYQTLIGLPQNSTDFYNNLYLRLKEYNEFSFNYEKPETYFFQLASDGINIKSLSNRSNNSTNNLLQNTLFDPNNDTASGSLKFMSDTNLKNLYFYLDKEQFKNIDNISGTQQYNAATNAQGSEIPIFQFNQNNLQNPDLRAKTFLYYNTFYDFIALLGIGNTNFDIYVVSERCVSELFNKKMRLFNGIFAVRKRTSEINQNAVKTFSIQNDLLLNVPASYLNRNTTKPKLNISTDDL